MSRVTPVAMTVLALAAASCGGHAKPYPPTPPVHLEHEPKTTYVSEDGVHFVPGRPRARSGVKLWPVGWRKVRFAGGRLTLSGLEELFHAGGKVCAVERVEVGPPAGDFRNVAALAPLLYGRCKPPPPQITLEPPGWTQRTIAVPAGLDTPDPRLTASQEQAGVQGSAVLQPDRRTIIVAYTSGGCHHLAGVKADLEGTRIKVEVATGERTHYPEGTECPMSLLWGETYAQLPTPAPPGVTIEVEQ